MHRAVGEKIGYAAQRFNPLRNSSVGERGLQLVEQAFGMEG